MLPFRFFLSEDLTPVTPESPLWQAPLPTSRAAAADPSAISAASDETGLTYGAYFSTIHRTLGAHGGAPLGKALSTLMGAWLDATSIDRVEVRLLKHGQFYHPSRITVRTVGGIHHLALNVALGSEGIDLLPRETAALRDLAEQGGDLGVPPVLAQGECLLPSPPPGSSEYPKGLWFLSPWFDGFYEFHLTRRTDGDLGVVVWDGAKVPRRLNWEQTADLLAGAGRLLATAINPHTLTHIFPWHHAAGDFVVHLDAAGPPQLRLITVRAYQPLLAPPQPAIDPEAALDRLLYAQLLLMVQAALRLRVDRLNGIGEIALYPLAMVAPICRGLLAGLTRMRRRWGLPDELDAVMTDYLCSISLAQLMELDQAIQGGFAPDSPERAALKPQLEAHTRALYRCLPRA
jgi:hypothetical protein